MLKKKVAAIAMWLALPLVAKAGTNNCEKLKEAGTPQLAIRNAQLVGAGALQLPPGPFGAVDTTRLPAFCRVQGSLHPTSDSDIKFELWMPEANWNHRYVQLGNGGLAGQINLMAMMATLADGNATAATDDGHEGAAVDGSWAIHHPEKVKDFGYRAVHETDVAARKLIAAYYASPAKYAYFNGCSEGGREALMEAQRYPQDFNGILAGSPVHYWTRLMAALAWNAQALNSAASFLPEPQRKTEEKAALAACPNAQGVHDKFIDNPLQCKFDPSVLLCNKGAGAGAPDDSCLTEPQVAAMKKVYAGPKNSRTGAQISPGYEPGAEAEPGFPGISFASYVFGGGPGGSLHAVFSSAFYGAFIFEDPQWNFTRLNFDSDIALTEQKVGADLNAGNPDLSRFKAAGGKLLQYHGWYDGAPSPLHSVEYYEQVEKKMGGEAATQSFYRLYMIPGMMHCGAGPGANRFGNFLDPLPANDPEHNIFLSLQEWVEKGVSPDTLIATRNVNDDPAKPVEMTRPLCAYPAVATWKGSGDPDQAANWQCVTRRLEELK